MGRTRLRPVAGFLMYSMGKRGWRTTYLSEVTEVADGDVLPLPGAPRGISMPGHSPGSIAVHVPAAKTVFVGDALTTRSVLTGKMGLQPSPFTDEPARALKSLNRLAGVDAVWVLPGHGAPWRGNPTAVPGTVRIAADTKASGS
ncbi:MBL fold metallo-hydrolase [Arthrobacter sp. zg-Y1219]|uniref:MBL fold metallo-hydrolase n=1 Tax=Arthrobacter sp. zg-Y1219 TaxID=3049067 RepID=UPI0024C445CE|nr:MBL fold metallo-hydrolase [Arthrobacter sp. zg-Y1219]MDK1360195.1 MBL fold metallo-hydrolase [Arthrobacter sp. zg-Y1219]